MGRGRSSTKIALILGAIAVVAIAWAVLRGGGDDPEAPPGRVVSGASDDLAGSGARRRASRSAADSGSQRPPPAPEPATPGDVFVRAGWGSGRGELGRSRPEEANPEGPMSLAEGTDGSLVVLDQVNGRLVRFGRNGEVTGTTPLGVEVPQDIATARDGTTAVLDRLVDRRVTILSPDGREIGSLPVEGEGIPESGGVTAVVIDGSDVYLERENGPLVRIGDVQARPADERSEVPGRPSRDGLSYIMAGLIEPAAGRFFVNSIVRSTREHRFTRELSVPLVLRQILLLDTDDAGVIYVAVAGNPYGAPEDVEEGRLLCLAPGDGSTIGVAVIPVSSDPGETLREMIVLATGGVLYSVRSEEGVSIGRFDCR